MTRDAIKLRFQLNIFTDLRKTQILCRNKFHVQETKNVIEKYEVQETFLKIRN